MDEALRRSNVKENTVLVGLDADCTVASNYLVAIEAFFKERPHCDGASIRFEHPLGRIKERGSIRYCTL